MMVDKMMMTMMIILMTKMNRMKLFCGFRSGGAVRVSTTRVFPHLLPTSAVGGVPWSERAHLLVLHSAGQRAELTLRAPASAHVAAALGLGHAVPAGGRLLAHGLQDLSVAVALPVVWRWGRRSEGESRPLLAPSPSFLLVPFTQPRSVKPHRYTRFRWSSARSRRCTRSGSCQPC